jgi:hypothetical protein
MLNQQKQKEEDPVGIRTETIQSISRSYSFRPFSISSGLSLRLC